MASERAGLDGTSDVLLSNLRLVELSRSVWKGTPNLSICEAVIFISMASHRAAEILIRGDLGLFRV